MASTAEAPAVTSSVTAWPGRPQWQRVYAGCLPIADAVVITIAAATALYLRYPGGNVELGGLPDSVVVAVLGPAWVLALASTNSYDVRVFGFGADEYRRVLSGCWRFATVVAVASYAFKAQLPRGFFLLAVPGGTAMLVAGRHLIRRALWAGRRAGRAVHRLVVVGPPALATELVREVGEKGHSGFTVVAVTGPDGSGQDVEVGGVLELIKANSADTVAVVGSADMPNGFIRRLAWQLEGTGIDLMVAPAITDVAGPRIHVRPVASLSMLYVEEPRFTGVARVVKSTVDLVLAVLLMVLVLPLLVVIAVAVKTSSPGPVFFRQTRLGYGGREFRVWKFRTMLVDAEARKPELLEHNESTGNLFKIRADPRVTSVGRILRRLSLDELPQLLNVLLGQMSLVGPRPLPERLQSMAAEERRRLLVKPGITGLWQVSGRSDLDWAETVRLDLYYVENWSLGLDLLILGRTVAAVLRGRGAY